ncbi:putative DNA mismatch repair protein MutS [Helianthus annuus]|nr:putative DNA mismatch repair protein MutS [Helianthus annuus]KAJ0774689.1 putative DNA mismatch repair protein MutS [Helianthus annuus]
MCIFEEKLDERILEELQDYEFAVSWFSDEDGDVKRFYYRNAKTRELDSLLGDIYHKILAITRDLVSHILEFSMHLLKGINFAAELDCFLSLALVARQNNYEMTVDTFIPNDTKIIDQGNVHIITGPNYSGKSIYIKQVALIVFLAHIGSFVPADAAKVGLTDRLDGIGLLGGTIDHFISMYAPPKVCYSLNATHYHMRLFPSCTHALMLQVLICTHLTQIFVDSHLSQSDKVKYYTMSVLRPDNSNEALEEIVFLYR